MTQLKKRMWMKTKWFNFKLVVLRYIKIEMIIIIVLKSNLKIDSGQDPYYWSEDQPESTIIFFLNKITLF